MLKEIEMLNKIDLVAVAIVVLILIAVIDHYWGILSSLKNKIGFKTRRSIELEEHKKYDEEIKKRLEQLEKQRELDVAQRKEDVAQSIKHDDKLEDSIKQISVAVSDIATRLEKMEETDRANKVEELKDRLTQSYRYYKDRYMKTGEKAWNNLEADAFWGMFDRYVVMGGNHFILEVVEPFMREFKIEDIE